MANGKLIADTIEHNTGISVTTDNVVRGTVKAWIAWTYSSSTPTTRDSFNITSNTDTGTGDVAFNLTNAMDGRFNPACTTGNQHATTGNALVDKDSTSFFSHFFERTSSWTKTLSTMNLGNWVIVWVLLGFEVNNS